MDTFTSVRLRIIRQRLRRRAQRRNQAKQVLNAAIYLIITIAAVTVLLSM